MKNYLLLGSLLLAVSTAASAEDRDPTSEAKGLIKQFATELKGELQAAMKSGGPVKAIGVCRDKAPSIAQRLSDQSGWNVARTSLKTRNPANAPDAWETVVLERFEAEKTAGADPKTLARGENVMVDGVRSFRFMKAIPTGKMCLACHGAGSVSPEVEAQLARWYPNDQARGFKAGDIRGAFTLSKPLD